MSNINNTNNNNTLNLKFIIIGDAGVGKTSLLHYFIFNKCKIKIIIIYIIL
jgi:GTPase SAR1 family protein